MPRPPVRTSQRGQQPSSPRRGGRNGPNNSTRQHLARKLADKPVGKRLDDSDDSDKLVTRGAGGYKGQLNRVQEIYASGAVAGQDKPGAHPTRAQRKRTMEHAMRSPAPETTSSKASKEITPSDGVHERAASLNKPQDASTQKASGIVPSTQPTPSRDASVLEGFKPRKRQPSILRAAQLDSSTLDLSNDSFTLPDDESTPVQLQKQVVAAATPEVLKQLSSNPRKRKLGSSEAIRSTTKLSTPILLENSNSISPPAPDLSLPPQSISALRASGQQQRQRNLHIDDEDVMAPPMSSSSSSSPVKPPSSKTKPSSRPHIPTTEELQALMPSKRRKMTRHRSKVSEFDITLDSASNPSGEEDDSFLPSKRRGKRQKAVPAKSKATSKPKSTKTKPKPKASTTGALQPTRSSRTNTTKSPTPASFLGGSAAADSFSHVEGQFGGSPRKSSTLPTAGGKENEIEVIGTNSDNEDEQSAAAAKAVLQKGGVKTSTQAKKTKKSMWDDIDAFEMNFEDVSVYDERSSDVNAR